MTETEMKDRLASTEKALKQLLDYHNWCARDWRGDYDPPVEEKRAVADAVASLSGAQSLSAELGGLIERVRAEEREAIRSELMPLVTHVYTAQRRFAQGAEDASAVGTATQHVFAAIRALASSPSSESRPLSASTACPICGIDTPHTILSLERQNRALGEQRKYREAEAVHRALNKHRDAEFPLSPSSEMAGEGNGAPKTEPRIRCAGCGCVMSVPTRCDDCAEEIRRPIPEVPKSSNPVPNPDAPRCGGTGAIPSKAFHMGYPPDDDCPGCPDCNWAPQTPKCICTPDGIPEDRECPEHGPIGGSNSGAKP